MKRIYGFVLLEQIIFNLLGSFILALSITAFMKYDIFLNQIQVKIYHLYQVLGIKSLIKSWSKSMEPLYCRKGLNLQENQVAWHLIKLIQLFKQKGYIYLPETGWYLIKSSTDLDELDEADYLLYKSESELVKIIQLENLNGEKLPYQVIKIRKQYFSFHDGAFLVGKYPQIIADGFKFIELELSNDLVFKLRFDNKEWSFKICTSTSAF